MFRNAISLLQAISGIWGGVCSLEPPLADYLSPFQMGFTLHPTNNPSIYNYILSYPRSDVRNYELHVQASPHSKEPELVLDEKNGIKFPIDADLKHSTLRSRFRVEDFEIETQMELKQANRIKSDPLSRPIAKKDLLLFRLFTYKAQPTDLLRTAALVRVQDCVLKRSAGP